MCIQPAGVQFTQKCFNFILFLFAFKNYLNVGTIIFLMIIDKSLSFTRSLCQYGFTLKEKQSAWAAFLALGFNSLRGEYTPYDMIKIILKTSELVVDYLLLIFYRYFFLSV